MDDSIDLEKVSYRVYSIYLESEKHNDIDLIKYIKEEIIAVHDHLSKQIFQADEKVILDSLTSLQVKLFNNFIKELAKGNSKQCEFEFWDYLQQVFRRKKILNQAEIIQIYSMCEGLIE